MEKGVVHGVVPEQWEKKIRQVLREKGGGGAGEVELTSADEEGRR
jgi:hypothetical protein